MSFGRLARTLALLLLGAMLFVRMGPMCEAIAQAAPPAEAHAGMADCDRAPPTPVKKAPSVDCVGVGARNRSGVCSPIARFPAHALCHPRMTPYSH